MGETTILALDTRLLWKFKQRLKVQWTSIVEMNYRQNLTNRTMNFYYVHNLVYKFSISLTVFRKRNRMFFNRKWLILNLLFGFFLQCSEPLNTDDQVSTNLTALIVNVNKNLIVEDSVSFTMDIQSSSGTSIKWRIGSYPQWLKPVDTMGEVDSVPKKVHFISDISKASFGSSSGNVVFSYAASQSKSVAINVEKTVAPSRLNFTNTITDASVHYYSTSTIYNYYLYLRYKSSWLRPQKDTVEIPASTNSIDTIQVSVNCNGLPNGIYYDTLKLISSINSSIVKCIPVKLVVSPMAEIRFTDTVLYLDRIRNSSTVIVHNSGNKASSWNITPLDGIYMSKQSGLLSPEQSDTVSISFDSTKFKKTSINAALTLQYDSSTSVLPLTIKNYTDLFSFVGYSVVAAAFSRQKNLILAIDSVNLYITNPDSVASAKTISLSKRPQCLSVCTNGKKAALGHDGFISIINLDTRSLDTTIPIPCNVYDLSMGDSVLYVFPHYNNYWVLHAVNLTTMKELPTVASINFAASGRIHPTQKYAYMIAQGVSPRDIYKIGISGGQLTSMYDSPYHGDYPVGDNFWYTEDGNYLISSSLNIFRLTDQKSTDILYAGKLQSDNANLYLTWADHHQKNGYIYASGYYNVIFRFTDDSFNAGGSYILPEQQMYVSGKYLNVIPDCNYIFVNDSGNKAYLLANAQSNSKVGSLMGSINTNVFNP